MYAMVVSSLAPHAYERDIGIQPSGNEDDFDNARRYLAEAGITGETFWKAIRACEEAAYHLVRSERYQRIVHALAHELEKYGRMGYASIQRVINEADPYLLARCVPPRAP